MVNGIEYFKKHFKDYFDRFVIVGGLACHIIHERSGIEFRATKDFDIVIISDKVDRKFSKTFMKFIREGDYSHMEKSTGKLRYYRFYNPISDKFPYMLELFSKDPEVLGFESIAGKIIKLTENSEPLSLSAIVMLNDYYDLIKKNIVNVSGLPVVNERVLIPLKARAYLDLLKRKNMGEKVDSRDIKKHKNDVFRLFSLLNLSERFELNEDVKKDVLEFIRKVEIDKPDLKRLGIKSKSLREVIESLKSIYI